MISLFQDELKKLAGQTVKKGEDEYVIVVQVKTVIKLLNYRTIKLLNYWIIKLLSYWIMKLLNYWIIQ